MSDDDPLAAFGYRPRDFEAHTVASYEVTEGITDDTLVPVVIVVFRSADGQRVGYGMHPHDAVRLAGGLVEQAQLVQDKHPNAPPPPDP